MYHVRIREMPDHERPRERLRDYGAESLSDAELLAILLRTGVSGLNVVQLSQQLLREREGWRGLQQSSFQSLRDQHGMGEAKAAQLKAALEIGRRLAMLSFTERVQIRSPSDVAQLMQIELSHLDQEHLKAVCLDTRNRVVKIQTVYVGTLNSAGLRVGEVFKEAIKINSAAIILAHNHPSGDPSPSQDDLQVNRQLLQAGQLLDIDVLDHLIIGHGRYVSLREGGIGGF
ncbi:MAG: DNA repair protein RadC [Chloroflexaceae bacterium]|nr:DNA repair protein RadC [Chloroflexaceae bacterium]